MNHVNVTFVTCAAHQSINIKWIPVNTGSLKDKVRPTDRSWRKWFDLRGIIATGAAACADITIGWSQHARVHGAGGRLIDTIKKSRPAMARAFRATYAKGQYRRNESRDEKSTMQGFSVMRTHMASVNELTGLLAALALLTSLPSVRVVPVDMAQGAANGVGVGPRRGGFAEFRMACWWCRRVLRDGRDHRVVLG
jgi:hypothetical protein